MKHDSCKISLNFLLFFSEPRAILKDKKLNVVCVDTADFLLWLQTILPISDPVILANDNMELSGNSAWECTRAGATKASANHIPFASFPKAGDMLTPSSPALTSCTHQGFLVEPP